MCRSICDSDFSSIGDTSTNASRSHNLDAEFVKKVNAVVRGTANYFDTPFSGVVKQFDDLDRWTRMRLRCMKYKCKRLTDIWRLHLKHLTNLGFVFLSDPRIPACGGNASAP
jgi:hypothetical protein